MPDPVVRDAEKSPQQRSMVALRPPVPVMLARATGPLIPAGDYVYEPKWDGFRCLIFVLDEGVVLQSRSEEDISYAFPEVVEVASTLPRGTVLDGELAVIYEGRIDFGVLSSRLRPRSEVGGNIAALAERHPAVFIAFDVLATPGVDLRGQTAVVRQQALNDLDLPSGMFRTPATVDAGIAAQWLAVVAGAGLDGVIAKPQQSTYQPGVRALTKVKPEHTADVVVAGWRPHKQADDQGRPLVGSLLLGVYDDHQRLHHIGSASSFSLSKRLELTELLAPLAIVESADHPWRDAAAEVRIPDTPNRWRRSADKQLMHVRPELVAEVRYDSLIDRRFRHVARLLRWRPDRDPHSCGFDQFPDIPPLSVTDVLTW